MQKNNEYVLNFGPHHPSTHGVLRLALKMSGEEVVSCSPEIGYLHRGVEKICENQKFLSIIPYVDRLDYLAPLICEHAYVLALEKASGIVPSKRAVFIRTIFDELSRISSHIMGIGSATYDMGCLSLFLYGLEEQEKIMDIFEVVTRARMHLSYYVPGGVVKDLSIDDIERIESFVNGLGFYLKAVEKLALNNRIFIKRTKGVGYVSKDLAIKSGVSGIALRASGINYDIRDTIRYGAYKSLNFSPIKLTEGDSYARSQLRFLEIKQSVSMIRKCLALLSEKTDFNNGFLKDAAIIPPKSIVYSCSESPRGEFGIHILTAESPTEPYRIRFKSPSFSLVCLLKKLLVGHSIADVTTILGSLDFLMGDCDR